MQQCKQSALHLTRVIGDSPVCVPGFAHFVAREQFRAASNCELPIFYMSNGFQERYLQLEETDVPAGQLRQRKLMTSLDHQRICSCIGERNLKMARSTRVPLAHVYAFLLAVLPDVRLTTAFIFHVGDVNGIAEVVLAHWCGKKGFGIGTSPMGQSRYEAGICVVTR